MKRQPRFKFADRTHVMGILNITPDSFYDGGSFFDKDKAVRHAVSMARDGADIIDVGGESTRPGAEETNTKEEVSRIIPVIRAISKKTDVIISVDTRKADVAEAAIEAGASIVNDVSGLKHDKKMAAVVAGNRASLIVMHMRGTPKDMQDAPRYKDVIEDITKELKLSIKMAKAAGISDSNIIIDPGIGFSKTVGHNLEILNRLDELKALRFPICIGTSRKSFIGKVLDLKSPAQRLAGTIATSVMAIVNGAKIIRVHDVKEAVAAARMTDAILKVGDK